jgi:outer membrane protein OmpA-like peptidoglycan-associated protein
MPAEELIRRQQEAPVIEGQEIAEVKPIEVKTEVKPTKVEVTEEVKPIRQLGTGANVYFENNSTEISPKEILKINSVVKLYAENKLRLSHIVIEGYASKRGRFDHNQKLSQSRAIEVKKKLMEFGLPESSLSIVGYGDQLEQSSDERENRRVQFRAYLTEGKL